MHIRQMSAKRPTESDALKIRCQQWRVGSTPTSGILENKGFAIVQPPAFRRPPAGHGPTEPSYLPPPVAQHVVLPDPDGQQTGVP